MAPLTAANNPYATSLYCRTLFTRTRTGYCILCKDGRSTVSYGYRHSVHRGTFQRNQPGAPITILPPSSKALITAFTRSYCSEWAKPRGMGGAHLVGTRSNRFRSGFLESSEPGYPYHPATIHIPKPHHPSLAPWRIYPVNQILIWYSSESWLTYCTSK